jgi:hypothetical protein
MELNSQSSSCEVNLRLKDVKIESETESTQNQTKDVIKSEKIDEISMEVEVQETSGSYSDQSSSSSSNTQESCQESTDEVKPRRKRKRKRHRKNKKSIAAYEIPEPFMKRYKEFNFKHSTVSPKLHLRFDEEGLPDQTKSQFNTKARVITALKENLKLNEPKIRKISLEEKPIIANEIDEEICIKPRIIKALIKLI